MSSGKAILPKPWAWAQGAALHHVCEVFDRRLAEGQPFVATAAELSLEWNGKPVKGAPGRTLKLCPQTLWRKYYYWRAHGRTPTCLMPLFLGPVSTKALREALGPASKGPPRETLEPICGKINRDTIVKYYSVRGLLPIRQAFRRLAQKRALPGNYTLATFVKFFGPVSRKLRSLALLESKQVVELKRMQSCCDRTSKRISLLLRAARQ